MTKLPTLSSNDSWRDVHHDVVLCNFGGPTSTAEVEPFLLRLFEDPFIIRAPLPKRLRSYIARRISKKRAPKAAAEYASIGYSPINRMTDIQAAHLEALLRERRPNTKVHVCNRYTAPSADEVVARLDPEKSRIFLITLYPHLCHSTTVSSLRDFDLAMARRFGRADLPSVRVFSWWHHPAYVDLTFAQLQRGLESALQEPGDGPLTVLFSAHGLPARYNDRGDPYVIETQAHFAELKRRGLAWLARQSPAIAASSAWHLSFQSRVGSVEWVRPYTDEILVTLGKERRGRLVVVPISFTSDHIETLYEMDQTYRELALNSGFQSFTRVKPANDDPALAACLADSLVQHGF